jgi:hypothetical protein
MMMTRRARKTLFYGLVALFLIGGTGTVLYAQGWRIDLATFKTEKVGAIFVESSPSAATITLNGKPIQNTTGFLSPGTLISNLFPKSYTLGLSAPGYRPWAEEATVNPTLVTEMKYAVLIPANASSASPVAHVTDFFETRGGRVVTQDAQNVIATPRVTAAQSAEGATSSIMIAHGAIVSHGPDFTTFVVRTPSETLMAYDPTSPQGSAPINLSALLTKASITAKTITAISVDPYDSTQIFVQTPSRYYTVDLSSYTVTPFAVAPARRTLEKPFAISSSWLAWAEYNAASSTSRIIVYDPFAKNVVDRTLTLPGAILSLKWIRGTVLGVLDANGTLYRYDVTSQTSTKMATDVRAFSATSDGATVAALERNSLEVISFTAPSSEGGYYRFNLPDIGEVQSLIWYNDGTHLFIVYPTHVNFLDLADLSLHNFISVASIATDTTPQYDTQKNALLLINENGALVEFNFPG